MKIWIMRHGEAGYHASGDEHRQLTERGKMDSLSVVKQASAQQLIEVDKVFVSPYIRAQETWDVIQPYVISSEMQILEDITPYGQSERVFDYLLALSDIEQIDACLLVSHLPLVGYLTSEFVPDLSPPMFPTSGLICIDYQPEGHRGVIISRFFPS